MSHKVYLILNEDEPNWMYVGTSNNPHKRFIKHCSTSSRCRKLKNAIKKYGREKFSMVVVTEFKAAKMAYIHETVLIGHLLEYGFKLYNMTEGGYGASGRTVRKKTREKISLSLKKVRNAGRAGDTDSPGREDGVYVQRPPVEDSGQDGQAEGHPGIIG